MSLREKIQKLKQEVLTPPVCEFGEGEVISYIDQRDRNWSFYKNQKVQPSASIRGSIFGCAGNETMTNTQSGYTTPLDGSELKCYGCEATVLCRRR
ncbi:hypothetical protein ACFL2C_03960 [Patescibacteria group bacterium]